MRWPWGRKKREHAEDGINLGEAQHAEARAIEDKHKAEAKWLDVADITARLEHRLAQNGFGADIRLAMQRRRP